MVLRQNAGEFSANLIGLMKTFAHQAVLAMRNARLFTEVDHKSRELLAANDIVREQADKLQEQTDQLKDWNRSLEERVETQLGEIERIRRLERFLAPQVAQLILLRRPEASRQRPPRCHGGVLLSARFTAFT